MIDKFQKFYLRIKKYRLAIFDALKSAFRGFVEEERQRCTTVYGIVYQSLM